MKKIYFACSIRGGRGDQGIYAELVEYIRQQGQLMTEIFADGKLTAHGSPGKTSDIWQQDLDWVKQADVMIAEVTNPSLGVGYEIAKAEEWGKPILCLYRPSPDRSLSAMIDGSPKTQVVIYQNLQEAKQAIKKFLA